MPLYTRLEHDEAVHRCAFMLVAQGYDVRARIDGWFDAPDYINGYRPDIVARSGNHSIIFEVKKGEVDWPKISAFEHYLTDHQDFEIRVLTPEDDLRVVSATPSLHASP